MSRFSIVIASDEKGGIARTHGDSHRGSLPWAKTDGGKKDTEFFRNLTSYSIVIMGRKTFESIGMPLKTRLNIVITSQTRDELLAGMPEYQTRPELFRTTAETAWHVAPSLDRALEMAAGISAKHNGVFVIGGAALLATAITDLRLGAVYWSHIPGDYSCNIVLPPSFVRFVNEFVRVKYDCDADVSLFRMENIGEIKYKNALRKLLDMTPVINRTEIPARSAFNMHFEWPLWEGGRAVLPLLTLKHTPVGAITKELMWFLSGDQNIDRLKAANVHIWDGNTSAEFLASRNLDYPPGSVGPAYGAQWRGRTRPLPNGNTDGCPVPDQLANVVDSIKNDPFSRRHLVVAWNPSDLHLMALPPCHFAMQFYVEPDRNADGTINENAPMWLSCAVSMRSCDIALGLPFNAASYGILTHMIAFYCGMRARKVAINAIDCHLYETHVDGAREMITRASFRPARFMFLDQANAVHDMDSAKMLDWLADKLSECFTVVYKSHPRIQLPMAI